MLNNIGVEDLSLEKLEELFNDDGMQETPPVTITTPPEPSPTDDHIKDLGKEETKAVAKRIRESREKAVIEERETIAKTMGYLSYADMMQKRDAQMLQDKGLDPEQVSPIVEELVKRKLNDDPRMKELEAYRNKQILEFGKKELEELSTLTDGEITSIEQLSPAVIKAWKQKGSLKSAYLELEGEKLITKIRSEQSKGSMSHLQTPSGSKEVPSEKRLLTDEEKQLWKFFNPKITDEELNKKTIDK